MTAALVLGTMTFGAQVDLDTARAMLDRCAEAGVTAVDTANVYADGASERIVGELIKGRREAFTIATKVGIPSADAGGDPPLSPAAIRKCAEASLRRLGTDYVDLYYLHQPDRRTPVADTLAAVDELVRAGTVLRVGVSNYAAWQLSDLDACAAANGFARPTVSQVLYNMVSRRAEREYTEFAAVHGLSTIAYNPLAGGLLTGKHAARTTPAAEGRFGASGLGPQYRDRYWNDAMFAAIGALAVLASEAGLTLVELAFRWLRAQPVADGVLVGASSLSQLEANLAAAAGPELPSDVAAACDEVWRGLDGPAPAYNR
jgi:aryl-alcohol dehydrogenase-like predicted oxidoreductase